MPLDLIESINHCLKEAEENSERVLDGLMILKEAYVGSRYADPSSFITNRGLEVASRGVICYRKIVRDKKEYDCLALDLREAKFDETKAHQLLDQLSAQIPERFKKEVCVADKSKLLIGIYIGK